MTVYGPSRRRPAPAVRKPKDPNDPVTEPQIKFLFDLVAEREIGMDVEDFKAMYESLLEGGVVNYGWASEHITEYQDLPRRKKTQRPQVPVGYYHTGSGKDRKFYVVVETKDKQRTYAKQLVKDGDPDSRKQWKWEYVKGAVNDLVGLAPLTLDEAAAWGKLHGACIVCGRHLDNPESVKDGIGPVCKKRLALP